MDNDTYEVGVWRFCPACGRGVIEDLSVDEFPRCACCERPWNACPCTPASEGKCTAIMPKETK